MALSFRDTRSIWSIATYLETDLSKPNSPSFNAGHSLAADMLCAYLMLEGSGSSVADSTGNLGSATLSNISWITDDWHKYAVDLNGTNSFIALPSMSFASNEASLLYILKLDSNSPAAAKTGIDNLQNTQANHYPWTDAKTYHGQFISTRTAGVANGSFDKTAWHHLGITTKNGAGNYKIFQNGSQINPSTAGQATITFPASPGLGSNVGAGSGSYFFDGKVSSIFFWDRALADAEMLELLADPWVMFR